MAELGESSAVIIDMISSSSPVSAEAVKFPEVEERKGTKEEVEHKTTMNTLTTTKSTKSPLGVKTGLVLKKKKVKTKPSDFDLSDIGTFFCKAKPEDVIELVTKTVAEVEETRNVFGKRRRQESYRDGRFTNLNIPEDIDAPYVDDHLVEHVYPVAEDYIESIPKVPAVTIPEPEPSWSALLKVPPPQFKKMTPAISTSSSTNDASNKRKGHAAHIIEEDIDPVLMAALKKSLSSSNESIEPIVDLKFNVKVTERLTSLDILPGAAKKEAISFKITNKTTVGEVKDSYCKARKIGTFNVMLSYRDVELFDNIRISKSVLDVTEDSVELILYDKGLFDKYKAQHKKQMAANLEMMSQIQNSENDHCGEMIDVSDLMHDDLLPDDNADGKVNIKIQVGRTSGEVFRISPDSKLSELLQLYCVKHADVNVSKARFMFDGNVLSMSQTVDGAELEDDDQLELRF